MLVAPEVGDPSICEMLRYGYVHRSLASLGFIPCLRLVRFTAWAEGIEEEILCGRPAFRLEGMAVLPSRQRQGIGSQSLIQALVM